jgi:hypothetical protein
MKNTRNTQTFEVSVSENGTWEKISFGDVFGGETFYAIKGDLISGYVKYDVMTAYPVHFERPSGPACPVWAFAHPDWNQKVWVYRHKEGS